MRATPPYPQRVFMQQRLQHPASDDWAWQATVVPHRSVKELWIGIGVGAEPEQGGFWNNQR